MQLISSSEREKIDAHNMFEVLSNFPKQITEAIEIGRNSPVFNDFDNPSRIAFLGMGGSAIGGDLLRSYCAVTPGADHLQFVINRDYSVPAYLDDSWYVFASSYSGGTEETISSYNAAKLLTKNIIVMSSGGQLAEMASKDGFPIISIPGGFMPRCALAYSFITALFQLMRISAFKKQAVQATSEAFYEIDDLLQKKLEVYSKISEDNPAWKLAQKMQGRIINVYSAQSRLDVVNLRWRGQIQENAKQLAFGAFLPEMNHNEINSWLFPTDISKQFLVLLLQDIDNHPRVSKRFAAIENIFDDLQIDHISLKGDGKSLLTRIFDLIYLADWTSYYLAIINNTDPTPIPVIAKLKQYMS